MESQKKDHRKEEESSNLGASIFVGALYCLAAYGGYKLLQEETQKHSPYGSGIDRELLTRIVDQEMKS